MAKHEQQAYERLGAKVLTLPDVIAQSVGFMGPVFSSAFVIPLVVGVISASGKGDPIKNGARGAGRGLVGSAARDDRCCGMGQHRS